MAFVVSAGVVDRCASGLVAVVFVLDLPTPPENVGGSGPPPPGIAHHSKAIFFRRTPENATSKRPPLQPPVYSVAPVCVLWGWVENTVEPWLREGT